MTLTAATATIGLSNAMGIPYTLVGALHGGETGATAVRDPNGQLLVLKWDLDPVNQARRIEAVALTQRLRTEAGWPVPHQRCVVHDDVLYVTQEFLPGSPVDTLTPRVLDEILDLHARRLGRARPEDRDHWAEDLIGTVVVGGNGYCRHESLRADSAATQRIVDRVEAIGRALTATELPRPDIVHWDFHPGNLLRTPRTGIAEPSVRTIRG